MVIHNWTKDGISRSRLSLSKREKAAGKKRLLLSYQKLTSNNTSVLYLNVDQDIDVIMDYIEEYFDAVDFAVHHFPSRGGAFPIELQSALREQTMR